EMAKRGVTLKLDLADRLPPVVGNRIQLQQVILNLTTNAADAMERVARDLRELVIRSSGDAVGTVAVAVRDAGVGIDPKNVDRVFDPFFTTKRSGMGMGLAICKSIIKAHDGVIWARTNPDRGATFHFTLPAVQEPRR